MTTLKITMCHSLAKHVIDDIVVASNGNRLIERCQTDHCISLNDFDQHLSKFFYYQEWQQNLYPLTFYLFPKGKVSIDNSYV